MKNERKGKSASFHPAMPFADAILYLFMIITFLFVILTLQTVIAILIEWRPRMTSETLTLDSTEVWDYIIVGGGSSGSVIAARLAEAPEAPRVLLLEAGTEDVGPFGSAFFKLPMAALLFQATPHHWGYESEGEHELVMKGAHWYPDEGQRGRPLIQARGKVLGGSSSINLINYMRGRPEEFDAWAAESGCSDWSWENLFPCFQAVESLDGALPTEDATRASPSTDLPASRLHAERLRAPHALTTGFLRACLGWLGIGPSRDGSSHPSHVMEAPTEGAGLHWITACRGLRVTNAALLRTSGVTAARAAGRFRIVTGCHALRVLMERGPRATEEAREQPLPPHPPELRAAGVQVREASGTIKTLRAAKEVILSAGAINTPKLLLLSGIGPSEELKAVGVDPVLDLPGVGKSLRDVAAVGVVAETSHPTLDKTLRTPWPYLQYLLFRSGPLATNTLEASAWISPRRLARYHSPTAPVSAAGVAVIPTACDDAAWEVLKSRVEEAARELPSDLHGSASHAPQHEAAGKLIRNREAILRDLTNPIPPSTQAHLKPVPAAEAHMADEFLREVASRLIGGRPQASNAVESAVGGVAAHWVTAAAYLNGRLQDKADQRPGRVPDLSEQAGAAMRAVLAEFGAPTEGSTVNHDAAPALTLLVQPMLFPFASWGKFRDFVQGLKAGTLPKAVTVHVVLLKPKSTGAVTLHSKHPHTPPCIRLQYFSQKEDLRALVAGVRLTRALLASPEAARELRVIQEVLPGNDVGADDDQLAMYVRENACHFNGSLCGTCKMGRSSDPTAVVDGKLRVRGVAGLRVADASIMPTLVSAQLNATVTAIAHKAATLILADCGSDGGEDRMDKCENPRGRHQSLQERPATSRQRRQHPGDKELL